MKWDKVFANMHLESVLAPKREQTAAPRRRLTIDEKELQAILEREFGPIKRPQYSDSVWKGISREADPSSAPPHPSAPMALPPSPKGEGFWW